MKYRHIGAEAMRTFDRLEAVNWTNKLNFIYKSTLRRSVVDHVKGKICHVMGLSTELNTLEVY